MLNKSKTTTVWHPLVHRRFQEELYFFLMSIKPFDEDKCFDDLAELMGEFGIKKFCAYQVFGQFDVLLRVWLPPVQLQAFIETAQVKLHNLRSIVPYHVTGIHDTWRFRQAEKNLGEMLTTLSELTAKTVRDVQEERDANSLGKLIDAGLLAVVGDYRSESRRSIKAFIAISEPALPVVEKREQIFQEIARLCEDKKRFSKVTIHTGLGFCWLLIKLVTREFYSVGDLVKKISKQYGADGISTSTFISATDAYVEGENISSLALDAKQGDPDVRLFLPELYSSPDLDERLVNYIEAFIKTRILKLGASANDKLAFREYFKAVLNGAVVEIFTALFPKFMETEQKLREKVLRHADRVGGVPRLMEIIDARGEMVKSPNTLPLAYVLRSCQRIIGAALPENKWVKDLETRKFDDLANFRNRIMHGGQFRRDVDWENFAISLINLIEIREGFLKLFAEIESEKNGGKTK
jgi:hypothetical protein